tara:strand:+ start:143 stop:628 length:486 start_codon:yes stop_codon:yes gene_type:complete
MSRELARAANDRIHGSVDFKHGKRYECVDWHEKNFDCKPWQKASGSEGYGEAMTDFTKAISKSVGKWINDDPEMKQLLQRVGEPSPPVYERGIFDSPEEALKVHGWTFVRYVCESLSWWTNSGGAVHDLPWTDFDICSHQSDISWDDYDKCMELLTKEVTL